MKRGRETFLLVRARASTSPSACLRSRWPLTFDLGRTRVGGSSCSGGEGRGGAGAGLRPLLLLLLLALLAAEGAAESEERWGALGPLGPPAGRDHGYLIT